MLSRKNCSLARPSRERVLVDALSPDFIKHFATCQLGLRSVCPVYDCPHLSAWTTDLRQHVTKIHPEYSATSDCAIKDEHLAEGAFMPAKEGCTRTMGLGNGLGHPCRLVYYHYHTLMRETVVASEHQDPVAKKLLAERAVEWAARFATGPHPGGEFPSDRQVSLPSWSPSRRDADGPPQVAPVAATDTTCMSRVMTIPSRD